MRAECKRVHAVTYQVRAETAEGLQALREKIKVAGGALWEEGIFIGGDGEELKRHKGTLEGVCRLDKGGGRGDTAWVRQLPVLPRHHAWYQGHQEGTAVGAGRAFGQAWVQSGAGRGADRADHEETV